MLPRPSNLLKVTTKYTTNQMISAIDPYMKKMKQTVRNVKKGKQKYQT